MARCGGGGKPEQGILYPFALPLPVIGAPPSGADCRRREMLMGMLALAMFIGLWGWGQDMFGWADPDGQVRLAIFASFIFGIICGFRVKD
jgi:hypothetical protein